MNFKFLKIVLHNFFSFLHQEVDLNNLGTCQVIGINHSSNDRALSNGSGKSSLFNGICYALLGKTIQDVHTGVANIYSDKDSYVELTFELNCILYTIKRVIAPRSMLWISKDGVDISGKTITESEEILKDITNGISIKKIGAAVIWGQGSNQKFSYYTPAERKRVLEEFSNVDDTIEKYALKLNQRIQFLSSQSSELTGKKNSENAELTIYNKKLVDYGNSLSSMIEYNLEEILKDLEISKEELKKLEEQKLDLENNILEQTSIKNEQFKKFTEDKFNEQTSLMNDKSKIQEELLEVTHDINVLTKQIKKIENQPDICPICGQKMPEPNFDELNSYKEQCEVLKRNNVELDVALKDIENKIKEVSNKQFTFDDSLEKQFTKSKKSVIINIEKLEDKIKSLDVEKTKAQSYEIDKQSIRKLIEDTEQNISRLTSEISNDDTQLIETQARLKIVRELLVLIKKDFRMMMLEEVIENVNSIIDDYAKYVFDNSSLKLESIRTGINITFNNKLYENLSGGERQKIDLVIQCALRDFLSINNSISSNILVLDEVFDNLDAVGCQNVLKIISSIKDLSSIFIISHHSEELELANDHKLIVEKYDDLGSVVKVE